MSDLSILLNSPYPDPEFVSDADKARTEAVMIAGQNARDRRGKHCPFRIPPAVAQSIARALA